MTAGSHSFGHGKTEHDGEVAERSEAAQLETETQNVKTTEKAGETHSLLSGPVPSVLPIRPSS